MLLLDFLGGGGVIGLLWAYWKWHTQQLWKAIERRCLNDYYLHGCFLWVIWRGPVRNYAGHHMHKRWRRNRPIRLSLQGPSADYPNWRIHFRWETGGFMVMEYAWEYHPNKPPRPIQSFADVQAILGEETVCLLWLGRDHATQDSFKPQRHNRNMRGW